MRYNQKHNQRNRVRTNYWIKANPVRLIDEKGQNVGIVDIEKARQMAQSVGSDLIEISASANPPVCRIMDFGKYQYQVSRKEKEQKHKQAKIEIKSIRLSPRIGLHDLQFKAKQADKFIKHGDKVRVEIRLRGREKAHQELAREKLQQFIELIPTITQVEQPPKAEPRGLAMIISKAKENDQIKKQKINTKKV